MAEDLHYLYALLSKTRLNYLNIQKDMVSLWETLKFVKLYLLFYAF